MFEGTLPALITPFTAQPRERPAIDYTAWEELIEWQISAGASGLVICGTTGESATLDSSEKLALAKRTLEIVKGRVPVIAGSGSNSTHPSVELTKAMKEVGVDAVLAVSPYYNKPTQEGLYQHFRAIAEQGGMPVVVYNIPGRTNVNISLETFERMAKLSNIVAVKQAVDSMGTLLELSASVGDKIDIFAGDDPLTYFVMTVGGKGVISASASVIPELMVAITREAKAGRWQEALKAQQEAMPIIRALFAETNPAPAKAALTMMGKIPGETMRLPLVPVTQATRERLARVLNLSV